MKIYDKKKINKALDIAVYPRGGGKIDLKPLASIADSVESNTGSSNIQVGNKDADEVVPANIYYIEGTEDSINNDTFGFLKEKATYFIGRKKGRCLITKINEGAISFSDSDEGRELKNVLFSDVYQSRGNINEELMDLDFPNLFMNDDEVGLHEIMINSEDGRTRALCKASNKRLIILLSTVNTNYQYTKFQAYSTYVLYDLTIERIFENSGTGTEGQQIS